MLDCNCEYKISVFYLFYVIEVWVGIFDCDKSGVNFCFGDVYILNNLGWVLMFDRRKLFSWIE